MKTDILFLLHTQYKAEKDSMVLFRVNQSQTDKGSTHARPQESQRQQKRDVRPFLLLPMLTFLQPQEVGNPI